jgi:hypothetical protein
MNKQVFISIVTVIGISLALVMGYLFLKEFGDSQNSIPIITQAEVDAVIKKQHAELKKQKIYIHKLDTDKDFAEIELRRIASENPRAKRMIQVVKAANLPIEFYGVIVDKENSPITASSMIPIIFRDKSSI